MADDTEKPEDVFEEAVDRNLADSLQQELGLCALVEQNYESGK